MGCALQPTYGTMVETNLHCRASIWSLLLYVLLSFPNDRSGTSWSANLFGTRGSRIANGDLSSRYFYWSCSGTGLLVVALLLTVRKLCWDNTAPAQVVSEASCEAVKADGDDPAEAGYFGYTSRRDYVRLHQHFWQGIPAPARRSGALPPWDWVR